MKWKSVTGCFDAARAEAQQGEDRQTRTLIQPANQGQNGGQCLLNAKNEARGESVLPYYIPISIFGRRR